MFPSDDHDCVHHVWAELDSMFWDTNEDGEFETLVCVQCGKTRTEDE